MQGSGASLKGTIRHLSRDLGLGFKDLGVGFRDLGLKFGKTQTLGHVTKRWGLQGLGFSGHKD